MNNVSIMQCEGCGKNVDKLLKTFVNDQPGENCIVSSYHLCDECYNLRFEDPKGFLEKINK